MSGDLALGPTCSLADAPGPGWIFRGMPPIPVPPHHDPRVIKPLEGVVTTPPSDLPAPRRQSTLTLGTSAAGTTTIRREQAEAARAEVVDLGPQPAPEVPARPAVAEELPRNAASLIRDAEKKRWTVKATYARGSAITTEMIEDVGAPPTPTGRPARKASTDWRVVESVVVRMASPWDDRAVFVFESGSCTDAYVARRGASSFISTGYKTARAFVLGPWKADMPHTPAWMRDKIEDRKRIARRGTCSGCGADVFHGIDQAGGEQAATVDAEPLAGPYATLTEIAYFMTGRAVFTSLGAPGGFELHRRDDFAIGSRNRPAYAEHRCDEHIENRSAA